MLLDTLPASDLAIWVGYQKLKGLNRRLTEKELIILMESLRAYRGIAAHLLWDYYRYFN